MREWVGSEREQAGPAAAWHGTRPPVHECYLHYSAAGAGTGALLADGAVARFIQRWYALAELVHGEAIAKLLKEGQQAALQQQRLEHAEVVHAERGAAAEQQPLPDGP